MERGAGAESRSGGQAASAPPPGHAEGGPHARHINRIKGLLAGQGIRLSVDPDSLERLDKVRLWDGSTLPKGLRSRLEQEYACLQFVEQQIKELEAERTETIRTSDDPSVEKVRRLMRLRGIGDNSAWLFVMEFFAWREFRNVSVSLSRRVSERNRPLDGTAHRGAWTVPGRT